jgi:hypothetical protein
MSKNENLLYRTFLVLVILALAAALRIAPHPRNFTPIGAMALFSGAVIRDRRLAFFFPLLCLFIGDIFVGFYKLMFIVYVSFLVSVAIGLLLKKNRGIVRIAGATLLGAMQFFLITNLGVWAFLGSFPKSAAGLVACYITGLPLFLNTLAGDAIYVTLFFGGLALAERLFPALRETAPEAIH